MPPESPVPGWSSGEVCRLNTATRACRPPARPPPSVPPIPLRVRDRARNPIALEGCGGPDAVEPAPEGGLGLQVTAIGRRSADLLRGGNGRLGRGARGVADRLRRALDLALRRLHLSGGTLCRGLPADLREQRLA